MIKYARKKAGYTQKQLSSILGISQGYLSKLENESFDANLSAKLVLDMAHVLKLSPIELFIYITQLDEDSRFKCQEYRRK